MASRDRQLILLASILPWTSGAFSEEKAPKGPAPREAKRGPRDEVEGAVLLALEWLRRHQGEDGGWKAAEFTLRCKKLCENADSARYGKGLGNAGHDVGVSALATLAFVRYAKARKGGLPAEDRECLKRACSYLAGTQVKSGEDAVRGRFGPTTNEAWIYDHALATLALAEAIGLPEAAPESKATVEEAIKFCLRAQNLGFAWRYGVRSGENDTSVTSWMVQALKAAKSANVNLPKAEVAKSLDGALAWYNRATARSGKVGYQAPGDSGSLLNIRREPYPWSKQMSSMTAAGVLGRLLAGETRASRKVKESVDLLVAEPPLWQEEGASTVNFYYWYYGTQALFQYGGTPWKTWSPALRKALIGSQRRGDMDEAGSWDTVDEWGTIGGRVYSTAINTLSLLVLVPVQR